MLARLKLSPRWLAFAATAMACAVVFSGCRHPSHGPLKTPQFESKFSTSRHFSEGELEQVKLDRKIDQSWLSPSPDLFTLGPGDKLEIETIGEPASKMVTVVAPDGKLYFSMLDGIDVWGLTLSQVRTKLQEAMGNYLRQQPQISVMLRGVESKHIWILGRVQQPGVYNMPAPMTMLEAISLAGGTMTLSNYRDQEAAGIAEEMADLRRAFLLRQGKLLPIDFKRLLIEGDLSQNIYLQPDDFLYLPAATAREVYVLGAVTESRPVSYIEGMTTATAIASAYGTVKGAYMRHVAVVRGSLSTPEIAIVDYRGVLNGEARDIPLQPGDIVYVPFSPYRVIERYAELILNTFVSASAINAGSAAVAKQATGGAGVFIPVGSGVQILPPISPPPFGH
jgi:polysaccharide export outer membrane protein